MLGVSDGHVSTYPFLLGREWKRGMERGRVCSPKYHNEEACSVRGVDVALDPS